MALNKRRLSRVQSNTTFGNSGFFRFKDGRNTIRVFSFFHTATKKDFTRGIYKADEAVAGKEYEEVDREVYRHFTDDGVINCLIDECGYCDEAKKYLDSSSKKDQKIGNQLRAKRAFYVNIVDIDNVENGVQICSMPTTVYNAVLGYINDPEFGEEVLGCSGRDFIIDYDKKADPSKMYITKIRDASRCGELDAELRDKTTDLFEAPFLEPGWSKDGDTENENKSESKKTHDDDDGEEEKPKTGGTSRSKTNKRPVENEQEDVTENPYKDEATTAGVDEADNDSLPWEKNRGGGKAKEVGIASGDEVSFIDAGEKLCGVVTDLNIQKAEAEITVGKDVFDIPFNEITVIPKKKTSRRR